MKKLNIDQRVHILEEKFNLLFEMHIEQSLQIGYTKGMLDGYMNLPMDSKRGMPSDEQMKSIIAKAHLALASTDKKKVVSRKIKKKDLKKK